MRFFNVRIPIGAFVIGSSTGSLLKATTDARAKWGSSQNDLSAFNRIAGMAKISNIRELVPHPLEQNEICWRSSWIARIANEERRASVNQTGDKMPIVDVRVIVKVCCQPRACRSCVFG